MMSPRTYRLGKRSDTVEQTRARIIAATRELLAEGDSAQLPVDEVARRADVARATVYYQFGSKAGLLEAVVRDIERRAGTGPIAQATRAVDPVEGLREAFVRGCSFWAAEHTLIRKLIGLSIIDADVRRALAAVQTNRLPLLANLVQRLEASGRLSASVQAERAIDILWLLSSFEAFDQLFTGRRQPAEQAAEILSDLALHQLIR